MAKEFATYDDQFFAAGQKSNGLRVVSDEQALSGRSKEDPLAELARIIGGTDQFRDSLRQNNRAYEDPAFEPPVELAATKEFQSEPSWQEPAFSSADFQPPVFEEHRWTELETEVATAAKPVKKEFEWDDLEAELASYSTRPLPVQPVAKSQNIEPEMVSQDAWADFEDTTRSNPGVDSHRVYDERDAYIPQTTAQWRDNGGQVQHALQGEREAEPYYTEQSTLPYPDSAYEDAAPPRSRRAGMMTVVVVLGVAALGGVGIAGYRALTGGALKSGDVKVVKADPAPMKVAAPAAVENAKRVQDRVPSGAEQVVSREEQPLSMKEQAAQVQAPAQPVGPRVISLSAPRDEQPEASPVRAEPPKPAPAIPAAAGPTSSPMVPVAVAPVAAPAPAAPAVAAPVPRPAAADEPRRVKTLAVGPDGNVRQNAQPTTAPPVSLAPAAVAAARPTSAQAAPQQVASAPVATGGSGSFVVQITSQRTDADARAAFSSIQRRQSALAGMSPNIKSVDLGDRGTYYRVRVGPMGRDSANDLCQKLKAGGNDCIVQPN